MARKMPGVRPGRCGGVRCSSATARPGVAALVLALVLVAASLAPFPGRALFRQARASAEEASANPTATLPPAPEPTLASEAMARVLIAFDRQPGPSEEALVRGAGGIIKYTYHLVPAIAATLPEAAVEALLRNPRVIRVEPDIEVYALDPELDNTWGVKRIGAGTVHSYNRGIGVKVAIIDSGIDYNHPDLAANYAGGYDFVNQDDDPMDVDGHGTHVAGTVAALKDGVGVVGVAPEARIYALKALEGGGGLYSDVIAAIQWCVHNGIQVTNNSYGSEGNPGITVKAAFDNAYAAGVLHVAAAGNSGKVPGIHDDVEYPARWDSLIAVAATNQSDVRASFSSTGPAVELAAPGVDINSTLPGGGYGTENGTSMAAPHVAGTAALVLRSLEATSPSPEVRDEARARLQATAQDLGDPGRDIRYGYGLVNAAGAAPPPISIVVSPTAVAYGTLALSASAESPSTQKSGGITVSNVGSVDVDLAIHGSDAIAGGNTWTLAWSGRSDGGPTTIGADAYVHRFAVPTYGDYPDHFAHELTYGAQLLAAGLLAGGQQDFRLEIYMPTSTASAGEYTTIVTLVAAEAGGP